MCLFVWLIRAQNGAHQHPIHLWLKSVWYSCVFFVCVAEFLWPIEYMRTRDHYAKTHIQWIWAYMSRLIHIHTEMEQTVQINHVDILKQFIYFPKIQTKWQQIWRKRFTLGMVLNILEWDHLFWLYCRAVAKIFSQGVLRLEITKTHICVTESICIQCSSHSNSAYQWSLIFIFF